MLRYGVPRHPPLFPGGAPSCCAVHRRATYEWSGRVTRWSGSRSGRGCPGSAGRPRARAARRTRRAPRPRVRAPPGRRARRSRNGSSSIRVRPWSAIAHHSPATRAVHEEGRVGVAVGADDPPPVLVRDQARAVRVAEDEAVPHREEPRRGGDPGVRPRRVHEVDERTAGLVAEVDELARGVERREAPVAAGRPGAGTTPPRPRSSPARTRRGSGERDGRCSRSTPTNPPSPASQLSPATSHGRRSNDHGASTGAWTSGTCRRTHHQARPGVVAGRRVGRPVPFGAAPSSAARRSRSSLLRRGVAASSSAAARNLASALIVGSRPARRAGDHAVDEGRHRGGQQPVVRGRHRVERAAHQRCLDQPALLERRPDVAAARPSRRVHSAMNGEAGSCAWRPPTAPAALAGSSRARARSSWRREGRPVERLGGDRDLRRTCPEPTARAARTAHPPSRRMARAAIRPYMAPGQARPIPGVAFLSPSRRRAWRFAAPPPCRRRGRYAR